MAAASQHGHRWTRETNPVAHQQILTLVQLLALQPTPTLPVFCINCAYIADIKMVIEFIAR